MSSIRGCDDRPRDPYDQLVWARKELEAARDAQERVIIAGHVPPGNKVGSNNFCPQHLKDLEESWIVLDLSWSVANSVWNLLLSGPPDNHGSRAQSS